MPLPLALLERLKRRKIIQDAPSDGPVSTVVPQTPSDDHGLERAHNSSEYFSRIDEEEEEEIFAEDHSEEQFQAHDTDTDNSDQELEDRSDEDTSNDSAVKDRLESTPLRTDSTSLCEHTKDLSDVEARIGDSVLGCPNKYNIYHNCDKYCAENYSNPNMQPTVEQRRGLALVLKTFPMSNEWTVVYDPGVQTFYFWNIMNNKVSWHPPGMTSYFTPSADQIRRDMLQGRHRDHLEEKEQSDK